MKSRTLTPLQLPAEAPESPLEDEYRFGDFLLRPQERQVLRCGQAQAITARALDVLILLVQRNGRLVTKDELMRRVWSGVVVEDNNIAVQVAQLRKLIGARAITTIAGVGYRFTAAVDVGPGVATPVNAPDDRPGVTPGNLPTRVPALIGRDVELGALSLALAEHPVVSICGAAGVGKTHLAMAAARQLSPRHRDGVYWVELAPLVDAAQLVPLLLRVLGIKAAPGDELLPLLLRKLQGARMLIVLDNAEHLLAEVERVTEALVRGTGHLTLLVTTQIPLRVLSQQVLRLGPMPLPDGPSTPQEARDCGAVQLLAQRAAGAGSSLAWDERCAALAVAICRELDGNALAIELAAARLPSLGLAGLAARLHQRFGLLAPSSQTQASRRNALAVAFDWSHSLLSEPEQRVFRQLSVFPGSFDLDAAAECLASGATDASRVVEIILDLVDRSLVSQDRTSAPRYRLLETARLYARDKLEISGETGPVRLAFVQGMVRLMQACFAAYWSTPPSDWTARWVPEIDNLEHAFDLAVPMEGDAALALYGAGWPLWLTLLQHGSARLRGEQLAPRLGVDSADLLAARFWEGVSRANSTEYPPRAREAAERAAVLYVQLNDARGQYMAWSEYAFNWRVDHPDARRAMALALAVEDPLWPSVILSRGRTTQATLDLTAGDVESARRLLESVLLLCQRDGDMEGVVRAGVNLADVERAAGELAQSVARSEAMLPLLSREGASTLEFSVLGNLIGALVAQGNLARAREIVAECAGRQRRMGSDNLWCALDALGLLHALEGRWRTAAQIAGAADRAYLDRGQDSRQPNEAADRARLDALMREHVDPCALAEWRAQGLDLDPTQVWKLALELPRSPE